MDVRTLVALLLGTLRLGNGSNATLLALDKGALTDGNVRIRRILFAEGSPAVCKAPLAGLQGKLRDERRVAILCPKGRHQLSRLHLRAKVLSEGVVLTKNLVYNAGRARIRTSRSHTLSWSLVPAFAGACPVDRGIAVRVNTVHPRRVSCRTVVVDMLSASNSLQRHGLCVWTIFTRRNHRHSRSGDILVELEHVLSIFGRGHGSNVSIVQKVALLPLLLVTLLHSNLDVNLGVIRGHKWAVADGAIRPRRIGITPALGAPAVRHRRGRRAVGNGEGRKVRGVRAEVPKRRPELPGLHALAQRVTRRIVNLPIGGLAEHARSTAIPACRQRAPARGLNPAVALGNAVLWRVAVAVDAVYPRRVACK